jgi:2-methylcitrate dehydratase PrpD
MAHILDYDDAHSRVRTHPSAPLVPAILAVAEYLGLSGRELITAFVVGCEVTLWVGYVLGNGREDSIHVDAPKGDPRNPLTFEDIAEKARDLGRKTLSDDAMDRIVDLVRALEILDNTAVLVRSCCKDEQP